MGIKGLSLLPGLLIAGMTYKHPNAGMTDKHYHTSARIVLGFNAQVRFFVIIPCFTVDFTLILGTCEVRISEGEPLPIVDTIDLSHQTQYLIP